MGGLQWTYTPNGNRGAAIADVNGGRVTAVLEVLNPLAPVCTVDDVEWISCQILPALQFLPLHMAWDAY